MTDIYSQKPIGVSPCLHVGELYKIFYDIEGTKHIVFGQSMSIPFKGKWREWFDLSKEEQKEFLKNTPINYKPFGMDVPEEWF